MKRFGIFAAALAATATLPTPAAAWNGHGHMVVAAVAWNRMQPATRTKAAALIRLNPMYARWTKGVPAKDKGRTAFIQAATWPDLIRNESYPKELGAYQDDGYTPPDADDGAETGYADHRMHRYWHFKDIPFATDGTAPKPPFRVNAETRIAAIEATLAKPGVSKEARSYDLTWLLHIAGDVHQPLHATARFSPGFPDGDNGGNGEVVCSPAPAKCETQGRYVDKLHSLWDDALGTSTDPAAAVTKASKLLQQSTRPGTFFATVVARTNLDAPAASWLDESFQLAKKYAYAPPIGDGKGPHFPDAAYRANVGSIASQQVVIAGERLARVLDTALK